MKMFYFISVRRLGLPGLTADCAICVILTFAFSHSTDTDFSSVLEIGANEKEAVSDGIDCKIEERDSDHDGEGVGLQLGRRPNDQVGLSLLCGISLSLEQHIYLKQTNNTNKQKTNQPIIWSGVIRGRSPTLQS